MDGEPVASMTIVVDDLGKAREKVARRALEELSEEFWGKPEGTRGTLSSLAGWWGPKNSSKGTVWGARDLHLRLSFA